MDLIKRGYKAVAKKLIAEGIEDAKTAKLYLIEKYPYFSDDVIFDQICFNVALYEMLIAEQAKQECPEQ